MRLQSFLLIFPAAARETLFVDSLARMCPSARGCLLPTKEITLLAHTHTHIPIASNTRQMKQTEAFKWETYTGNDISTDIGFGPVVPSQR